MIILLLNTRRKYRDENIKIPSFIMLITIVKKIFPFSYTESLFRILFFSISSPAFQKSSPGFSKRNFFESKSASKSNLVQVRIRVSKYALLFGRFSTETGSPQKTLLSENVRNCDDINWFRFSNVKHSITNQRFGFNLKSRHE